MTVVANYEMLREALQIADGQIVKAPTLDHLIALRDLIETLRAAISEHAALIDELLRPSN